MKAWWLTFVAIVVTSAFLLSATTQQSAAQLYQSGVYAEEIEGSLQKAIGIYEQVLKQFPNNRETAANAQLHIGLCYEKLGLEKAREAFEKVIKNYPGQAATVAIAQAKLDNILRTMSLSKKGVGEQVIRLVPTPAEWEWEGGGRVSPDGKYFADVHKSTGDLWLGEILTGKQRRLTTEGKDYSQFALLPQWSPDSTKLAFGWYGADRIMETREIALDGSPSRLLVRGTTTEAVFPLDWSPDGKRILTARFSKQSPSELTLVSVVDGSARTIKTFNDPRVNGGIFLFSPDGLGVAYSRPSQEGAPARDIFLLSADGSGESPLIQHQADATLLAWLPDGRGILFASDRSGTVDLWTIRVEKGQPQGVPTLVRRAFGPVTSMGLTTRGGLYYRTPESFMDVYTASLDPNSGKVTGSPGKEPLPYEGHNRMPNWSPDGRRLVYVSTRPGETSSVLCIYSADTGKVREFRFGQFYGYPRWAPDGRHLYLQAAVTDGQGIHRMDVESGEVTPFMAAGEGEYLHHFQVSADGKWIVYGRESETAPRILRRDARSGQEQEIDRAAVANNSLALSPDGRHLAMILRTDEKTRVLKVMEFPDGTPKEIHRFALSGSFYVEIAWSPDGRFIYYRDNPTGKAVDWRLRRIAAEGGEAQDLGLVTRYSDQLSVHPDGSRLTFSAPPTTREPVRVWVMENFLPATKH